MTDPKTALAPVETETAIVLAGIVRAAQEASSC